MLFFAVKALHILGATAFLGTGAGSAWFKVRAWRSGDVHVVAWTDAEVVQADWVFTVPSGLLMPATGFWLAWLQGLPWDTPWLVAGLTGYAVAGLTWLPAAWLQVKMKRLSAAARDAKAPLPRAWHDAQVGWLILGLPSFSMTMLTLWLMVAKAWPG